MVLLCVFEKGKRTNLLELFFVGSTRWYVDGDVVTISRSERDIWIDVGFLFAELPRGSPWRRCPMRKIGFETQVLDILVLSPVRKT